MATGKETKQASSEKQVFNLREHPVFAMISTIVIIFVAGATSWITANDFIDRKVEGAGYVKQEALSSLQFSTFNCRESGFVNSYDMPVNYSCPANTVMVGSASTHDSGMEDRVFSFECCELRIDRLE